ncbi:hypothetical protein K490DRAFT_38059 [Saccharata proteae CBS 121410]|uniref:Azaphilone pigments biosynthesis cluster protein L N-terminal domain-containing protein n=1 Tax=Saccharata proteae CBS 121410 TaxID=1314787 RepID=A0A6A5YAC0_9PEZI|nr:hypothetical protein K490DRAFT_38059 [Saccharata proteae CBS 121410]
MAASFEFSAGDFIAGINILIESINAIKDSAGSSAQFIGLNRELYGLERALLEVNALEIDASQASQYAAIKQTVAHCQEAVDVFMRKIKKYQPTLRVGGSANKWRDTLHKIEWRLFRKEDIEEMHGVLATHTAAITMGLVVLQTYVKPCFPITRL